MNAIWSMVFKSLVRNVSRNLLQASLILFATFSMAYFAQFLAGITKNYTENLVQLATGDMYISSELKLEGDENLFDREYEFLSLDSQFLREISALPEVEEINARIEHQARITLQDDTVVFGISAFDPEAEQQLSKNFRIVEGRFFTKGSYEMIVPEDFARRHQIKIGDNLPVLARTPSKKMNLITFKVTGIFEALSLSAWFNHYMYTDLASDRALLNDEFAATRLNIHLYSQDDKDLAMNKIETLIGGYKTSRNPELMLTWWEDGAEFFSSLVFGIEAGFFIIVGVICTILACSIGFATVMAVIERTREIATLGALGAPPKKIRKIFLMENVLLSDLASLTGVGLAALAFMVTVRHGIPITNPELQGFLGASHFYPAFDIAGFIVPFLICKMVTANVSFLVVTKATKKPIADALADR